MLQKEQVELLRFTEKTGLFLMVLSACVTIGYYLDSGFRQWDIMVGTTVTGLVGMLMFLVASRRVRKSIDVLISQSNFATNEQFISLFERSPVPYITVDRKGFIIKINQAGVQLCNATVDTLVGSNFLERVVAAEASDPSIVINKVKAGMTLNDVVLAIRPDDGEDIWVLFSSHMNIHTKECFISLINITQAKKVDEAKSEFVALATHQLRTPIAAIRWNVELLEKHLARYADEKAERYFDKIQRNIERMATLISDFLNVSKLELGTFATEKQTIYLTEFVDATIEEFAEKIEQKFITVERIDVPDNFSFTTDVRLLQVILSNLFSNAVKYVQQSGTIWLSISTQDNKLVLQVSDNGIGIPETELDDLFTKFYRATNAKQQQAEGTGLGLYIVKQAVEQLGGTITVMSGTNKGAAFTVSLPLAQQSV